MTFEDIIGNSSAVRALKAMADSGRVPHAMMLYENDGCGALALALAFLRYVAATSGRDEKACAQIDKLIYPGIRFSFPITTGTKVSGKVSEITSDLFLPYWRDLVTENPYFLESELSAALGFEKKSGLISTAEGKAILQKLSMSWVTDGYRAIVMYLPEKMNVQTANMLLKEIEEPSEGTIFILITHAPQSVLPTISSRCQALRILPLSREEVEKALVERFGKDSEDAAVAASLCGGSIGAALHFLSDREETNALRDIFKAMLTAVMDKNLYDALASGEEAAALDSREKQKLFCSYASGTLRQIFMVQQGLESISGVAPSEEEFIRDASSRLPKGFARRGMDIINHAALYIDRNVAQKAIFANMAGKLYETFIKLPASPPSTVTS